MPDIEMELEHDIVEGYTLVPMLPVSQLFRGKAKSIYPSMLVTEDNHLLRVKILGLQTKVQA
jgi:hypothetical protein